MVRVLIEGANKKRHPKGWRFLFGEIGKDSNNLNATVRWTVAGFRLDGIHSLQFAKGKLASSPFEVLPFPAIHKDGVFICYLEKGPEPSKCNCPVDSCWIPAGRNPLLTICHRQIGNESFRGRLEVSRDYHSLANKSKTGVFNSRRAAIQPDGSPFSLRNEQTSLRPS